MIDFSEICSTRTFFLTIDWCTQDGCVVGIVGIVVGIVGTVGGIVGGVDVVVVCGAVVVVVCRAVVVLHLGLREVDRSLPPPSQE